MLKKTLLRKQALVCAVVLAVACTRPFNAHLKSAYAEGKAPETDIAATDGSYYQYAQSHGKAPFAEDTLTLDHSNAKLQGGAALSGDILENKTMIALEETGSVEFTLNARQDARYQLLLEYYPLEGYGGDIELELEIDGRLPFNEAASVKFSRIWQLNGKIEQDNRGNDILPSQEEAPRLLKDYFRDKDTFNKGNFMFYISKGEHKIKLTVTKEALAVLGLQFCAPQSAIPYKEYEKNNAGHPVAEDFYEKLQAENTYRTSTSGIFATNDSSSPAIDESSPSASKLNTLGLVNYKSVGQWASWNIKVEKTGLYKISFKYKQNFFIGFSTARIFKIDDEIPFEEMALLEFPYTSGQKWAVKTLSDPDGHPYYFYLDEGEHELRLEVCLGPIADVLNAVNQTVRELNDIYRKIITLTGTNPDPIRDYYLHKQIPELIPTFQKLIKDIDAQIGQINRLTSSEGGSEAASLLEVKRQLERFVKMPETIQTSLEQYQNNVSALAFMVLSLKDQPLVLDYITVSGSENEPENPNASFIQNLLYRTKTFLASFVVDYSAVGNTYDAENAMDVWVSVNDLATSGFASGRDQMSVIKRLIDNDFYQKYKIPVNLKLVDSGSVLTQAVLAKKGPDIAMIVPSSTPINLAMRDALVDLSKLGGFNEMKRQFFESAFIPLEYNGGVYAMPETQNFWMQFYRKDIFDSYGLSVPDTWEDFYVVSNKLMKNNLEVGIPESTQMFETLLLQHGGSMYNADHTKTMLHTDSAADAFTQWTELYSDFGLEMYFNAFTRFRTGEMPLMFSEYTFYNYLVSSAPELSNLWGMAPLPGINKDGKISRMTSSAGTCSIILKDAENVNACFEFVKWWASAATQASFGNEIEARLGPASRYNTANIEAFKMLPWSAKERGAIQTQWTEVSAIPNVPGNYYAARCLINAFRQVVLHFTDPKETLDRYNSQINSEITRKRKDLGLAFG